MSGRKCQLLKKYGMFVTYVGICWLGFTLFILGLVTLVGDGTGLGWSDVSFVLIASLALSLVVGSLMIFDK